ncbi:MAG TPA: hypothetical protein VFX20_09520 [Steroidobacteraceae bacterium]|nr:hypothetical protein [Steroidobacteraceae bacterium]
MQEFFCPHGRRREVQLADGPHYPVLLSIEQIRMSAHAPGLRISYRGHREDLIALGCVSRERLASARYGQYQSDPRGAVLRVERKATPGRRRMIELSYLTQARVVAGLLPGVRTYCADWLQALTARPLLRLVIDNTAPL